MKFVSKGNEPDSFRDWKSTADENWQPTYDALQNPEKRDLHRALLNEQGFVCCYCGRSIDLGDSHIEHFRPQEKREDLALDFSNLHCSCIRGNMPGIPLHCGHRKGSNFDEDLYVSPIEAGCEQRFRYTLVGEVLALDARAAYMTTLLGLDIEFLRNRRKDAMEGVFDDDFLTSATHQELTAIRDRFRQVDQGVLPSFGHVLARYAEQLLEQS